MSELIRGPFVEHLTDSLPLLLVVKLIEFNSEAHLSVAFILGLLIDLHLRFGGFPIQIVLVLLE